MLYTIYKTITVEEFAEIKSGIQLISESISKLMEANFFYLNTDGYSGDILGLDYLFERENMFGNIGFAYQDEYNSPDKKLFSFYITKTTQKNNLPFFQKKALEKKYEIDEIVSGKDEIFSECLNIFNSF